MSNAEQTFIMVKVDGVQRSLVGEILGRFERRGYKIVALKMIHASKDHVEKHYADLKDKPFFAGLTSFMSSGPVVAIVFEGKDVRIKFLFSCCQTGPGDAWRYQPAIFSCWYYPGRFWYCSISLLAACCQLCFVDTNDDFPLKYAGIDMGRNICHGSDSVESAKKEIGVVQYRLTADANVYE
ncbi:nucleoside diphosphate kinase [Puccinia sorghi]|uniref:Nucleoside diphosphate kinase n=1 Tax=Puccinia sorghi TaxID=27349 RepID=A0A0L6V4H6_9BASI|nr:nucleoside diphosphate kinase [Puccinia sorghi]